VPSQPNAQAEAGGYGTNTGSRVPLDVCDRARFAPGSINPEEASSAIDRASEIIEEFEKLQSSTGENT